MNFLILNGPRDPRAAAYPQYRGTYRAHPTYCDAVPEHHELNKLFFWFLEEGGELGVTHDLAKTQRYADLLNQHAVPRRRRFEIVEVTKDDTCPEAGTELLGFDLSSGYNNSLLWWHLEPATGVSTLPAPIQELDNVTRRFYSPQLNGYSLFQAAEIASECLSAMDALQKLSPNLYEGEDLKPNFSVTGVYLVASS
jgi:hypothetical protein